MRWDTLLTLKVSRITTQRNVLSQDITPQTVQLAIGELTWQSRLRIEEVAGPVWNCTDKIPFKPTSAHTHQWHAPDALPYKVQDTLYAYKVTSTVDLRVVVPARHPCKENQQTNRDICKFDKSTDTLFWRMSNYIHSVRRAIGSLQTFRKNVA